MSEVFTHVLREPNINIVGKNFAPLPSHWLGNFEENYYNHLLSFLQQNEREFNIYLLDELFIVHETISNMRKPVSLVYCPNKTDNKRVIGVLNRFFNEYDNLLSTLYALRMQELREVKRKV